MKKTFKRIAFFAAILVVATFVCASFVSAAELDTTQKVAHAIKGTPTVDGEIDEMWAKAEYHYIENVHTKSEVSPFPKARFRTMWDDNYLYLLYEVSDTTIGDLEWEAASAGGHIWKRDSITFAFSPTYDRSVNSACQLPNFYYMLGVFGYSANFKNAPVGVFHGGIDAKGLIETPMSFSKVITNANSEKIGYVFECKVDLTLLEGANFKYEEGVLIGFDTFLNDNDPTMFSAVRDNLIGWNDESFNSNHNYSKQGTIQLCSATYSVDNSKVESSDAFFGIGAAPAQTTEATTAATTAANTTAATTKAATTKAATTAAATTAAVTTEAPKSGCGSAIGMTAIAAIGSVCLAGVMVAKKKED